MGQPRSIGENRTLVTGPAPLDAFDARCAICGDRCRFVKDERATRESYACPSCRGSLRYQGQARVLLQQFSRRDSSSIAELVRERAFRRLHIWEPGEIGPFRRYLTTLRHYERSSYSPDSTSGERHNGLRYEDLMATTFSSDRFDLIVTSDILEHVRKPYRAFREIYRVLRPGGAHVFSIPVTSPMRAVTVERVDTSGTEDVFVLEPRYHNDTHLVYNDFGEDLLGRLEGMGFRCAAVPFETTNANAARLLTFSTVKRRSGEGSRTFGQSVPTRDTL